ncbi:hypothetical protein IFR05_007756 [Cadophora sp. M221]|nr:hypothetical protein IFR05_007756 [Cadophora sp. M221]
MPFPKITRLHAYFIFAVVIIAAIVFEQLKTDGFFGESENGYLKHPPIGIELGRTYSRVATFRDGFFELVVDKQGQSTIPSCNRFTDSGDPISVTEAADQSQDGLTITLPDLSEIHSYKFEVKDNQAAIKVPADGPIAYLTAQTILSQQLTYLKTITEAYLNQTVHAAVISVPAYFNDTQRGAIGRAAESAGLSLQLLASEARAASHAYHTNFLRMRHGKGEDDDPAYILICSTDDEWLSVTVEYYFRGVYRTVGSVDDRLRLSAGVENLHVESASIDRRVVHLLERVLNVAEIDSGKITGLVIAGESPHVGNLQSTLETFFPASLAHSLSDGLGETFPYLLDTTSLDLGVRTQGASFLKLISKDVVIPITGKRVVVATTDDLATVVVGIYQGTSLLANDYQLLGRIELDTLPMGPGVEVDIEISFRLDAYGALTVEGTELTSKRNKKTTVVVSTTLDS